MFKKFFVSTLVIFVLLLIAQGNAYALPSQPNMPGGPGGPTQPQNPNPPSQPAQPNSPFTPTPAPIGGTVTPAPSITPDPTQPPASSGSNNSSNSSNSSNNNTQTAGGAVLALSDTGSAAVNLVSAAGLLFTYTGLNLIRRKGRK